MVRASHRCHFMISLFSSPPCSREGHRAHWSDRGHPPTWGNPRGFFAILPSKPPPRAGRRACPQQLRLGPAPLGPGLAPAGLQDPGGRIRQRERAFRLRGPPMAAFLFAARLQFTQQFHPLILPDLTATLGRRPGLWHPPHFAAAETL